MPILELRGISKRFGHTLALERVDLSLQSGEVLALIGENGAGKSTLMNVISGAVLSDAGSITLDGEKYKPVSQLDARKNGIALIHQELSLAPHLTVAENILLGSEPARFGWIDRQELDRRALAVLRTFHHPEIRPETYVGELSNAARQIVEICRAIVANARIILMDEPTSSLQRGDVEHLFRVIRELKAGGIGIIYISHFLEEVREIADSFSVLRDGRSVASGKIADVSDNELVAKMSGRTVENLFPKRGKPNVHGKPVMQVKHLAAQPALRDASFELWPGEILGIAGLVGAGRSEMLKAIIGIDRGSRGAITIDGRSLSAAEVSPGLLLSHGVGYLSEDRKSEGLALPLSVADNITLTRFSSCARLGWLNLDRQLQQAESLVETIGVRSRSAMQPVGDLSGGNQQKIAVARLVHQQANILLLDEPTRGIDIGSRERIYRTIADLADSGCAVLLISSYLPELFGMCDRLAVMTRGRLSEARPISEWTPELVLQDAIGSAENRVGVNSNGY